jgi:hypothetical protein
VHFGHRVLSICTVVAIAGCAASPPPLVTPATMSNRPASSQDLLYAVASAGNAIYVFSYPAGKLVKSIRPPKGTIALQGLCSDTAGDVYLMALVAESGSGEEGMLYEYKRGAGTPEKTIKLEGVRPFGCAVDPKTGDLAYSTASLGVTAGYVDIQPPDGSGKIYYDYNIANYYYCGFDGSGNLFVDGQGDGTQMYLAEIKKDSSGYPTNLALSKSISLSGMGQIQWDGTDITLEDLTAGAIYRLKIDGTKANIVGTTRLGKWYDATLSWIDGARVLVPTGEQQTQIGAWNYPKGGKAVQKIVAPDSILSVMLSAVSQQ